MTRTPYTLAEDDTLTFLVGDVPWPFVLRRYNDWAALNGFQPRSEHSLACRSQVLNLKRQPFGEWVTTGHVYRTLNISENRIRAWLERFPGILYPSRPSRCAQARIYIRRDRLRTLARRHPEQFAGCSSDDLFMLLENRDMADQIAADHPSPPQGIIGYKRPCRPVRCITTGEVFPSVFAVAAAVGRSHTYVCESIRRGWRCAGRQFAYAEQREVAA